MTGFVDIHSHVLHGLDDGAATIEESVAMLRLADASGTTHLVCTPHANASYPFDPALTRERMADLQPRTSVRLYVGCDFHLQADNIADALDNPDKYTLNHGQYLLVEFPDLAMLRVAGEIFRRLIDAGMTPIISHPERNEHLRARVSELEGWVRAGCHLQVTAASYSGLFGPEAKRAAEQLFTRGLVHIVASDAHDTRRRTPVLRDVYMAMCDRWGEARVRPLFVENPAAVVANDVLPYEPEVVRVGWRRWLGKWV